MILCIGSCSCFVVHAGRANKNSSTVPVVKTEPAPAQDVIIQFLKWYKANLHKANSFALLTKDSAGNFMVDQVAGKKYLSFLKSSKYLSGTYIAYWETYFNDKAAWLKSNPTQTDQPEGFDFDFVLITQEPETVLNQISRTKFKTVSMNSRVALIGLKWAYKDAIEYEFEMYRGKEGWQISYISTPNFD